MQPLADIEVSGIVDGDLGAKSPAFFPPKVQLLEEDPAAQGAVDDLVRANFAKQVREGSSDYAASV